MSSLAAEGADHNEQSCDRGVEEDVKYRELYTRCWHPDRDRRPTAVQLVDWISAWSAAA